MAKAPGSKATASVEELVLAQSTELAALVNVLERRGLLDRGLARPVALWLAKTLCDLTHAETARHFRLGSPGSARGVCGIPRQPLREDRRLRRRIAAFTAELVPATGLPTT